jgi:ABC-type multidrug transport system fused ATPase/permease subunit
MVTLMLLDIVISIADIAFLALLLFIIRVYTDPHAGGGRLSMLVAWFTGPTALLSVAIFFLLFSGKNAMGFLIFRAQCRFLNRVASRVSRQRLLNYLEGNYSSYTDVDSSVHIRQISYHPLDFCQHVLGGMQQMVTQSVLIVLSVAGILLYNAQLFFLLFVVLLPPLFAVFYWIRKKLRGARNNARTSSERSLQHLQEAITGFVESNVYQRNEVFLDRFMTYQQQFNKYVTDQMIVQGLPARLIEIFALLGIVILIAVSQWSTHGQGSSVITIGVFMAAAYKIIPGIVKLLSLSGQVHSYAFTVDDLAQPVDEAGAVDSNRDARATAAAASKSPANGAKVSDREAKAGGDMKTGIRSVAFRSVRFSYAGRRILNAQHLDIAPGDFLGIAGPSGRGKTTVLNILLGFLTPDQGEVLINGEATDPATRQRYWRHIAYVKQQPFLIHDSIRNNVTLNGQPFREKELQEAIRLSGLDSLIATFPEKENKVITESGKNISGGQRQRIAIARALYKSADLIILDEPFNELDEESERRLLCHFRYLTQNGKMVILITHNKQSLAYCNKTITLDERQAERQA